MQKSDKFAKKIIVPHLKEIREYFSLNQTEFAKLLSIEQNKFSRYENGVHEFTDELKIRLVDKILSIYEKRININWLITGEGEMFLSSQEKALENTHQTEEKHPLIASLGAFVDQRLEKIEAEIAEIKSSLNKPSINTPDFDTFTSEPEPEYGEDYENVAYVDNIAAGRPIDVSDNQATIPVPKRFIKTKPEDYYAGRIKGTSMIDAGISNEALVLIFKSDIPRHNAIQVVERRGEVTLKRVWEIPGKGWKLYFEDGTGDDIEVGPEDVFHVQGDFVAVLPEGK